MRLLTLGIILFCLLTSCQESNSPSTVLVNAHAHNDYEHDRPLHEALDNQFVSVEADVFMIDGNL